MNEGTWDLSVFYQDFDDPALRGDIDAIRAAAEGMENLLAQDRPEADRLEAIEGMVPDADEMPQGCHFHPRCPYAVARCRQEAPPLTVLDDGRCVRCFKVMEEAGKTV